MDNNQQTAVRDVEAHNVSGSVAGASSGDFHVYRRQRRHELERLEQLEKDARDRQLLESRLKAIHQLKVRDEQKTAKRAAKRRRKKNMQILARNNQGAAKRCSELPRSSVSQQLVRDNQHETRLQLKKQLFSSQTKNEHENLATSEKAIEIGHDGHDDHDVEEASPDLVTVETHDVPIEVCSDGSGLRNEENSS